MGLRWLLASTAALGAAAACCSPAMAIVGGDEASLTQHPYQVALVRPAQTAVTSQFCGGSIRDVWHIITAAHCVWDNSASAEGQPVPPSQIEVLAGTENLTTESAGQRPTVATVSVDPEYSSATLVHDAALLTLAAPLTLGAKAQPVQLVGAADAAMSVNEPLFVTGWGDTDPGSGRSFPDLLQGVRVNYVSDTQCSANYNTYYPDYMDPATQLCAAAPGKDACQGDSGGPLVRENNLLTPGDDRLVGIVSLGIGCASSHFPGIYTEIAVPSIRAFVTLASPPPAPTNLSPPTLSGNAAVGGTLSCSPGAWAGAPSFSYQFVRSNSSSVDVGMAAEGPGASYTVTAADAGTALRCVVLARNDGGTSFAATARTGLVPGQATNQGQSSVDRNAPVAKVVKTRCTVTRCTLTVTVTDAGFSAGIKTVRASVTSTYRGTCRRNGRKVRCTRHKTKKLTAKRLAATKFRIVASKLPVGKQVFTLYAVDKAGHKQRLATKKTVRTKRKRR